jgi:AAA15 family ATPase/GTPase
MSFLGFVFSGYRSIGDELVVIAPLKKINLIIGKNNSGKSNIINFLAKGLPEIVNKIGGQENSK